MHSIAGRHAPRVLIIAEHASVKFGGEAILPFHFFQKLRRRGVEAWLVVHARTRDELLAALDGEGDRIEFIDDTPFSFFLATMAYKLPERVSHFTLSMAYRLGNQIRACGIARRLIAEHGINVVHQPIPVSPKEPSILYGLGVPVVMGPLNGGMEFPPAFRARNRPIVDGLFKMARKVATAVHWILPGKRRAAVVLVANERTRRALPGGIKGEVITLVENGVDLSLWTSDNSDGPGKSASDGPTRFAFVGRLVDWKRVDLLLEAFGRIVETIPATLDIYGDGVMRFMLEARARELGLGERVVFHGWLSQEECAGRLRGSDALVLPSMYECGGAVVLEAMAVGLPVIATNWGGPADYLDETCGILVDPDSRETFIDGLAVAMTRLAESPALRETMGKAGREKVLREYDWERKTDKILEIYQRLIDGSGRDVQSVPQPGTIGRS